MGRPEQDHPRLIHASGSGFGESGPLAGSGGQDMLAQSLSGVAHHARTAEGRPVLHPIAFADFGAGMVLVQGVLLGLYARERTGRGLKVHVNLLDVMLTAQMQELTQWRLRGEELNFVSQYLAGVFRAADGWVTMVGLFRRNPLRVVCGALDMDDLSARSEFSTDADQLANRAELFALLDEGSPATRWKSACTVWGEGPSMRAGSGLQNGGRPPPGTPQRHDGRARPRPAPDGG